MQSQVFEKLKHPLALSILAGILNGTSYIPFPPWAVFFGLSPLFYIWITQSPLKVFFYTALTYSIGILIGFFWIHHTLREFAFFPWYLSIPTLLFFCMFLQIHLAIAGFLWAKFLRPWTKVELLGASAFFALSFYLFPTLFPWNYGYTWLYGGLQGYQFADMIGFDGLNILTILLNAAVVWAVLSKERYLRIASIVAFILTFNLLGYFHGKRQEPASDSINVLITQANIGNFQKHYARFKGGFSKVITDKYLRITKEGLEKNPESDLVIWPETAFPELYRPGYFFKTYSGMKLKNFIIDENINLISGFYVLRKSGRDSNSAMFFNKSGDVAADPVYKKILLAFGEYLPFEQQLPWLRKLIPMAGKFERGTEAGVRKLDNINYGVQICYEGLHPGHTRELAAKKAQIIVNLTNDSWYGKRSEPKQHMYITASRAVESRLPLIRSTNTGITTVALPSGKLLEQSPLHVEGSYAYKVPYKENPVLTKYNQFGWALPLPFMIIMVILSLFYGNAQSRLEEDTK